MCEINDYRHQTLLQWLLLRRARDYLLVSFLLFVLAASAVAVSDVLLIPNTFETADVIFAATFIRCLLVCSPEFLAFKLHCSLESWPSAAIQLQRLVSANPVRVCITALKMATIGRYSILTAMEASTAPNSAQQYASWCRIPTHTLDKRG